MTDSATDEPAPIADDGSIDAVDDAFDLNDVVPATTWAIPSYESPLDAQLVLRADAGTAVAVPLNGDLMDTLAAIDSAQQDLLADEEHDATTSNSEGDEEEPEDDDRGPTAGISRVTGWHQISLLWTHKAVPQWRRLDTKQRIVVVAVIAAAITLIAVLTRL